MWRTTLQSHLAFCRMIPLCSLYASDLASPQSNHFPNSVTLRFSERSKIIIKTTIGSSISMKLAYQTQTKQNNDQSHLECVEHVIVVNKIHTSIKKTVHVFCKILKKYTSNAPWIRLVSVLVGFLFDMQISLILKINHYLFGNGRVKILACSLKRSVTLFWEW